MVCWWHHTQSQREATAMVARHSPRIATYDVYRPAGSRQGGAGEGRGWQESGAPGPSRRIAASRSVLVKFLDLLSLGSELLYRFVVHHLLESTGRPRARRAPDRTTLDVYPIPTQHNFARP